MDRYPPERRELGRIVPSHEGLALVTLPNGERRLEPIFDVGPQGVSLLVRNKNTKLRVGDHLPDVSFFTLGTVTLSTPGVVRDINQVSIEGFGAGFKIGVHLQTPQSDRATRPATEAHEEAELIADMMRNLNQTRPSMLVILAGNTELDPAPKVSFVGMDESQRCFFVRPSPQAASATHAGQSCRLRCELYGTRLDVVATLREQEPSRLRFDWPSQVIVWHHRTAGRVRNASDNLFVEYEAPFGAGKRRNAVADVSGHGVAFETNDEECVLVGMIIPDLSIILPNRTLQGRGVVRNVRQLRKGRHLVGVELTGMSDNVSQMLHDFVGTHIHPQIHPIHPRDLPKLWALYDELGVFGRSHAALAPIAGRIDATRHGLFARGRHIFAHVVGEQDGSLEGYAELIRLYPQTWSLQQVGSRRESKLTYDQLVIPLVEQVSQRADFRYLHALIDSQEHDGFGRLASLNKDSRQVVWHRYVLMRTSGDFKISPHPVGDVAAANPEDIQWICAKLADIYEPVVCDALGYKPSELRLQSISKLFHNVGLERRRDVRMGMSVSGPNAVALVEQSSPGVHIGKSDTMARLIALEHSPNLRKQALGALLQDVVRTQKRLGAVTFLIEPHDAGALRALGCEPIGERLEVVATHTGAAHVLNLLNVVSGN